MKTRGGAHIHMVCVKLAPLRVRMGVSVSGIGTSSCTELERLMTLSVVHACMYFATLKFGPRWTYTRSLGFSQAADLCGNREA